MNDEREFSEELEKGALGIGLRLAAHQTSLAWAHARLLLEWNLRTNLTRVADVRELARRHFVESLLAASLIPQHPTGPSLLDIGSGAGFPGLAARVVRPDLRATLLEPRGPKAAFLSAAAALYPPPPVRVVPRRLQELSDATPWDVITTRALKVSPGLLLKRLAGDGLLILFAGPRASLLSEMVVAGMTRVAEVRIPDSERLIVGLRRGPLSPG